MNGLALRWNREVWRRDPGPHHELRLYVRGRPTGLVAITAWEQPGPQQVAAGTDVWLICEPTRFIVAERLEDRPGAVRLQIPLRSCADATLTDEPGLPGNGVVRLSLTVRIGQSVSFPLSLWFPVVYRPLLEGLVQRVQPVTPVAAQPIEHLPVLQVEQAPDHPDWIVFRPAHGSEDVVTRVAHPAGEGL
ncbi:hypothetical protein [Kibdelosporangium aridum]|uniref:hypothetical protein n=1 Tax=Kibdelosporangium aridum TaxID=2030 RepID=UPI000526204D